ncbi:MAG: hypothetical protein ACYSX0_09255 [Planctomycetota bacterium]
MFHVMDLFRDFNRNREREERWAKRRSQPRATPRQLEALARRAEKLRKDARSLFPPLLRDVTTTEEIAFWARDMAEQRRQESTHARPKKSGRILEPVTVLLWQLDHQLTSIPATKRREWIARAVQRFTGIDVGDGEKVRKRLVDYRLKPGRSPHR